jgi:hypothetical protein
MTIHFEIPERIAEQLRGAGIAPTQTTNEPFFVDQEAACSLVAGVGDESRNRRDSLAWMDEDFGAHGFIPRRV